MTVQMWHDKSGQLKQLPWTPEMTVDEAKKVCEAQKVRLLKDWQWNGIAHNFYNLQVLKIKQTLTDVIENALQDADNTYEVFLVIVPAATRGNPFKSSDHLCLRLDEYRQQRNTNAK